MHEERLSLLPLEGRRDEHGLRQGWFRFFNSLGELVATAHYRDDLLHGEVTTMQGGQRVAELRYRDGVADGPFRRRVHAGTYRVDGAAWEEGTFACGLPCGPLRLRNTFGDLVFETDFGRPPPDDQVLCGPYLPTAITCADDGASWFRVAIRLNRDHRTAEALAAMVRGVGAGGSPEFLRAALAQVAAPVTAQEAERRASVSRTSGSARVLLAALLRGAEPTQVLRRLALVTPTAAAPAFLHAAIALVEWPLSPIVARALRNVADPNASTQSVLDDAATLAMSHAEDARVLCALASRKNASGAAPKDERGERPTIRRRDLTATQAALATHATQP